MENNSSTTVNSKPVLQEPVKEPVKEHTTLYTEPDDEDMFYINEYWSGRPGKPRYYDANGDEI